MVRSWPPFEAELLAPWKPTRRDPWDSSKVGHLLRRAGFIGTDGESTAALRDGLGATLERIFQPPRSERAEEVSAIGKTILQLRDTDSVAAWWLQLMIRTHDGLRDKIALMWHGHFAVSDEKVKSVPLMAAQIFRFREYGLGDLRALTRAVSRDPAMLRFLDGNENRKGHPNENFARELFELFLLGEGNYTEHDIQEAARAFTGYREHRGDFEFKPRLHDAGPKTVFAKTGQFDGDDIIELCFERPEAARFLAQRLATTFVAADLPEPYLQALAELLRSVKFEVRSFLDHVFRSRLFFHPMTYRCLVKTPVEYAVGALRALDGSADGNKLHRLLSDMGQRLLHPPGVQGWAGGEFWLTSARMVARNRFAHALATKSGRLNPRYRGIDPEDVASPQLVQKWLRVLVDDHVPPSVAHSLQENSTSCAQLLQTLLMLPEFHVA